MDIVGDLDRYLEEAGEDVLLRRKINGTYVDVTIRAAVRLANKPDMLVSGTTQDDLKVVTSMTKIRAASWPGTGITGSSPFGVDTAVPRRGDELVIKGARHRVEAVNAIAVRNTVVRLVVMTKGGASGA